MRAVPKSRVPFDLGTVEQDSREEIAQCVYVICATPLGSRSDQPEFGISDVAFRKGGVDLTEIRAAIERWEPRAVDLFTDEELLSFVQTVEVDFA